MKGRKKDGGAAIRAFAGNPHQTLTNADARESVVGGRDLQFPGDVSTPATGSRGIPDKPSPITTLQLARYAHLRASHSYLNSISSRRAGSRIKAGQVSLPGENFDE